MTRRSDDKLRTVISEIECLVFSEPTTDAVIIHVLKQVMFLFDANFGYVYKCGRSNEDVVPWELLGCQKHNDDGAIEEITNSCSTSHIPKSIEAILLSGRCLFNTQPEELPSPIPHFHPPISNFLCLPLVDARSIHAVLYICNATVDFSQESALRLRPLLAASSCIVRAAEKQAVFNYNQAAKVNVSIIPNSIRVMIDALFDPALIVGAADKIVACNQPAQALLDPENNGLVGTELKAVFPKGTPHLITRLQGNPSDKNSTNSKKLANTAFSGAEKNSSDEPKNLWHGLQASKTNGEQALFDMRSFKFSHGGQLLKGLVLGNISGQLEKTSSYHSILQRFQVLTHMVPVGILQLNREWDCIYVNDTYCEYCQMSPEELDGNGWLESVHPDDINNALIRLRKKAIITGDYSGKFRLQSPLGRTTWVQVDSSPLYSEKGKLDGLILTFNDITKQLINEKRLQDIAEKDQLTGLTNRTFFNDRIAMALKGVDRYGKVALMFLDLDEFKKVNDTLGHDVGDQLLRQVAQRLELSVRKADTIARIGGDEFTILLTNIDNTGSVTAVADKLINSFKESFVINEHSIYVTCSIGIVITQTSVIEQKVLLKQADIALYKAKELGRNQYKFYTHDLDAGIDVYLQLKRSIKETSANDFHIVYQPQVDARTGEIVGLEALTRWTGNANEDIGPDVFMKIIENSGLINEFSEWLFDTVLSQVERWNNAFGFSDKASISVNLSAKQFKNVNLASTLQKTCALYNVSARSVILEMTETAIIEDPDSAIKSLTALKEAGFELSLDDFGTGYSSLSYLRNMPFHSVKIDKTFTQDVVHDKDDGEIVAAIIGLAKKLNLKVIAEGVNSELVKDWLIANDCCIHQGFYFYKPIETSKIEKLLTSSPDVEILSRVRQKSLL